MAIKKNKISFIVLILIASIISIVGYFFALKDKQDELRGQAAILVVNDFEDYSEIDIKDDSGPIIAIIVDGIGFLNPKAHFQLPSQVALGMPSYVPVEDYENNEEVMKHNLLLNIPVEPANYPEEDPDPGALLLENDEMENFARLSDIIAKSESFKALYSSHDEKYTYVEEAAENLLQALKNKNLIYFSGLIEKEAAIYKLAKKMRYNILSNDLVIDAVVSKDEISQKLAELEEIALLHGSAIGLGNSYPITVDMLNEWIPTLVSKGIKIVSIEDFYKISLKRKALKRVG